MSKNTEDKITNIKQLNNIELTISQLAPHDYNKKRKMSFVTHCHYE